MSLDTPLKISAPEGYLHHTAVLERGWEPNHIKKYLQSKPDHIIRVEVPAAQRSTTSNKAYSMELILEVEENVEEVKEAREAIMAQAPRLDSLEDEPLISLAELVNQGWTVEGVLRWLGEADKNGQWAVSRADWAKEKYGTDIFWREGTYLPHRMIYTDRSQVISKPDLRKRGWMPRHIKKYLGEPDYYELSDVTRKSVDCWGLDRVEAAEGQDDQLQSLVDQAQVGEQVVEYRKKKAAEKARIEREQREIAKKEAAQDAYLKDVFDRGYAVFRFVDPRPPEHVLLFRSSYDPREWMLQGKNLVEGQHVKVLFKDGSMKTKIVGKIAYTDDEGIATAFVGKEARQEYDQVLLESWAEKYRSGDDFQYGSSIRKVAFVKTHRISPDDPSVYGSHLLGFEGQIGQMIYLKKRTNN